MSRDFIKTPECVSFVNYIKRVYNSNGKLNLPKHLSGKGIEEIDFEVFSKLEGKSKLEILQTYIKATEHIDPKFIWEVNRKGESHFERIWMQPLEVFKYTVPKKQKPSHIYYSSFKQLKTDWSSFKFTVDYKDFIVINDILYVSNKERYPSILNPDKIPVIDITAIKGKYALIQDYTLFKGDFEDKFEFDNLVCIETYGTKVGFLRTEDRSFKVKFIERFGDLIRGSKE